MKHQILALAVAALSFTACSNEDNINQDYLADTPIKLNVSVDEPTTRAGYSNTEQPEGFGLIVQHSDSKNDKYNYNVWAEGNGTDWKTYDLESYLKDGTKKDVTMLWANMNDKVAIAALSNVNFDKIPTDQTSAEGVKKADLLTMPVTKVVPSTNGINVDFKHTMSKIKLTIELGDEYEFAENVDKMITDVKIDGSKVEALFHIKPENTEFGFEFDNISGNPTPVSPFCTGTTPYSKTNGTITKAKATYEAILIPQTIASGKFTVSFKVDGKLYEWTYNKELTLAPTTAYTLKLTAGDDKVQPVSFSVAPWGVGNGENGEKKETD